MRLRSNASYEHRQRVVTRYRRLGVEWGVFIGALLGVIAGGFQMHHWENPLTSWGITTAVFVALGAAGGYVFYDLVFGAQIRAALGADLGDLGGAGGNGDGGGD